MRFCRHNHIVINFFFLIISFTFFFLKNEEKIDTHYVYGFHIERFKNQPQSEYERINDRH